MCTGVKITSKQGNVFWGRTQEFDIELAYEGVIVPSNTMLNSSLTSYQARYAFVGVGIKGADLVVDGVNEAGLCGGSFCFGNYNQYMPKSEIEANGKLPLTGEEFITWALANCATVDEVKEHAPKEVAITSDNGSMGASMPQHYVLQDATGKSIAVEPSIPGSFAIYDNPVGTFTNSPKFDWHLTNLQNYVGLQQGIFPEKQMGEEKVFSSGKGNGLHGLPGDFTPQSRFVRATFLHQFADQVNDDKGIELVFHVLDNFDIPKGVVVTGENHKVQYTQYTSAYDVEKKAMYIHMYDNRQIQMICLADGDGATEPVHFAIEQTQQVAKMKKI